MSVLKGIYNGVKKEIDNYSHFTIRTGTTNVGKQLASMTSDEEQLISFQLNNVTDALKTGQELIKIGQKRLKTGFPQQQNSHMRDTKNLLKK